MKRLLTLMAVMTAFIASALGQRTASGYVYSVSDDQPVIGATVLVKGTKIGTATDLDGNFTIENVPATATTLVVSYVGMHTQEVPIGTNLRIGMSDSSKALDEVMVVAFGTTTKEAFTGSAAVVNSGELSKHTTANVADALVGSVPGLQMRSTTGAPGSSQGSIKIRGISSLYSGTDPLVIVDGAPYPENLSNISPNDIASVSVLKDAASAALYGARGAAGVIIITTKRGMNKEAEINVNAKWGSNSRAVPEYDVIDTAAGYYEAYYAQLYNYAFYQQGLSAAAANAQANTNLQNQLVYNIWNIPEGQSIIGMDGKINPNATLGRYYEFNGQNRYLIPDNFTDLAYRNGLRQEYNLSINGGTDRASFYAAFNYLNEEGILKPSGYDRITGRIRADYQAKKWLKVGANVSYMHSKQTSNPNLSSDFSAGNILYFTSMVAPIYPMFVRTYGDDKVPYILKDEGGNLMYDYGVGNYEGLSRPFSAPGNPIGDNVLNNNNIVNNNLNATFTATVDFTSFLKLDVNTNVNWIEKQGSLYQSMYSPLNSNVKGKLGKDVSTSVRTNNSQTLTYYNSFGDHNLNVMLGHEYYRVDSSYLYGYGEGGFSPDIQELNAFANRQITNNSYKSYYNVEGWFGSAQYNYADRYYASASYRRDASSRFDKAHRWGNFWSVGGAWIISKENFMARTENWLDYLKLKVSVGQQGNDNISSSYAWTDMYNLVIANPTTMSPVFNKGFGNPEITWETTTNTNVGLEFGLFGGRLNGTIDYYHKHTKDLLFWLSVPESTGGRGYYGNMGSIRNSGVELSLSGSVIRTNDFEWTLAGNLTHNRSKILSLPDSKTVKIANNTTGEIDDYEGFFESPYWYQIGGEMYNYMTLAYAGVSEDGQALYYYDPSQVENYGGIQTSVPGKIKSKDYVTTNTGYASRYEVGSVLPKLYGGFSTTLRIKWFDISAIFDYQIGGKVMDSRYASLMSPTSDLSGQGAGTNFHKDWIKSWSPNNTTSDIPRWQVGDQYTSYTSDRFLTNAGYLNFQSFTVGFTFPKIWKEISKLRVYCSGENLCFWSARKGLDPRYSFSGNASVGAYSPIRTVSGGLEVTF